MAGALRFSRLLSTPARPIRAAAGVPAAPAPANQNSPGTPSSNTEQRRHRLAIFQAEQERQRLQAAQAAGSIEVTVRESAMPEKKLPVKQGVSTPMDVARELLGSEAAAKECALALINDSLYLDMGRPLVQPCSLKFIRYLPHPTGKEDVLHMKAFTTAMWRSGSMIIGSVMETAFKAQYTARLISSPVPFLASGSFLYDIQVTRSRTEHSLLKLNSGHCLEAWSPSRAELRVLSRAALTLLSEDAPFEMLDLPLSAALHMFKDNPVKAEVAKRAATVGKGLFVPSPIKPTEEQQKQQPTVVVYRVGDFVDMLGAGPLLSRVGHIGHLLFAAVHRIESPAYGPLARVQGAALPAAASAYSDPAELDAWIASALERAAAPNVTFPPTRPPPLPSLPAGSSPIVSEFARNPFFARGETA